MSGIESKCGKKITPIPEKIGKGRGGKRRERRKSEEQDRLDEKDQNKRNAAERQRSLGGAKIKEERG